MKNNITSKIIIGIIVLCILSYGTVILAHPGTEDDPLVSSSYLDQRLLTLNGIGITDELLYFLIQDITRTVTQNLENEAFGNRFTPVNVTGGRVLLGGEGTEIILRTGSATAFTEVLDGVINITTGNELFNGYPIPLNNTIIIPRDDNRGVVINSENAWFLIRGSYSIR